VDLGACGPERFGRFGIDLDEVRGEPRRFATACGDWTERRPHLGGALGAALWVRSLEHGWVARKPGTRIVVLTGQGSRAFQHHLGVVPDKVAGMAAPRMPAPAR